MKIGIVGINHKLANLLLRDILAKVCYRRFGPNRAIHSNHHFVLLSTCNRTEIYFTSQDLAATHSYILNIIRQEVSEEFDQKLYSYFGLDCFLHLSRVASGLDSAIVAETEIQGQVKIAYETAAEFLDLPKELHFVFQKALKNGKQVRSKLPLGRGIPNIEHAIWQIGKQEILDPYRAKILFVGASEINHRILTHLKAKGAESITICNRTDSKAESYAKEAGIHWFSWKEFYRLTEYDWIIFGTKATDPLLKKNDLSQVRTRKLLIDLSVPRNIDPLVDYHPKTCVYNIDSIHQVLSNRKEKVSHHLTQAEELIQATVTLQASNFICKEKQQELIQAFA